MTCTTSIDAMFKRKRGRPPKNRVIEVGALGYLAETSPGNIDFFKIQCSSRREQGWIKSNYFLH